MPAAAPATRPREIVFFELLPEVIDVRPYPACPDGSGDLWWDDASYARYQAWDPYAGCHEATLVREVDTADYCDGIDRWERAGAKLCDACRAKWVDPIPF